MDRTEAQEILSAKPFNEFLDPEFDEFEPGRVTMDVPFREEFLVNVEHEIVHGGVLSSLLDVAGHYAVLSEVETPVPTVDLRIDYRRSARKGPLVAEGEVTKLGSNLAYADAELRQEQRGETHVVATGRGVYSVEHVD